jgi:uncharacterized membrane protein YjjP (DUF1212 family)
VQLILQVGRALQDLGTPAHRLEDALQRSAERLNVEAQFFSTPTALFSAFGPEPVQQVHLVRVPGYGAIDRTRMTAIDRMVDAVDPSPEGLREALDEIKALAQTRSLPFLVTLGVFGATSFSVARFLGGGWSDMAVAAFAGAGTGLLSVRLTRLPAGSRVFELAAAFLAAFVATAAERASLVGTGSIATLAGLIVLVPGLGLTVAMSELATRNLASGSARLVSSIMALLLLGFGAALGRQTGMFIPWPDASSVLSVPASVPGWATHPCVLLASLSFAILFRVPTRYLPWTIASAHVAFWSGRWSAVGLGPELGSFLAALAVCLLGNAFARVARAPASIVIVPGVLLLVPGSIGFRSLTSFMSQDPTTGVSLGIQMLVLGAAVVSGVLVAALVLPPRRSL